MKHISDEMLTDYIFDLLEGSEKKSVEQVVAECSETKNRLNSIRRKFIQLNLIEEECLSTQRKPKKFVFALAAAAVLAISLFISTRPENPQIQIVSENSQELDTSIVSLDEEQRMFQLEKFAGKQESFSLLAKLEAPVKESVEFDIPEVKIDYEDEDYEIVDLGSFSTLSLPSNSTGPSPDLLDSKLFLVNIIY